MTEQRAQPRWWTPGDWNAFFGLGTNSLLNILVLSGLLLGVVGLPGSVVFGRILPAIGLMLLFSNVYYAWMARRLALREGRTDVTALPAGPSVPHMFIVVLIVMLPVRLATGDPILAWQVGLAWAFIEGIIETLGALVGPTVRRLTPRAALLGTLAGVSLAFIAMGPAMQSFLTPWIGLVALALVVGAWFGRVRYPFNLPAGLVVIVVGTAIGWATGLMTLAPLQESVSQLGLNPPVLAVDRLVAGFADVWPLLVTAIPFGIYNFVEAMDNVESAAAAGDEYPVREVMVVDGVGTVVGTMFGSPFPSAVYIGHPGWKSAGGRIGYSVATGALAGTVCLLGIVPVLLTIIPLVALLPILLYIGLVIGAQAFQTTPRSHAPAIVLAMVPHFAAWGLTLVNGALGAAGTSAAEVGADALAGAGVLIDGLEVLGGGAILTGMVLGAMLVFVIERDFVPAAGYALAGAVLAFFGFIHGPELGIAVSPGVALGYVLAAGIFLAYRYLPAATSSLVVAPDDSGAAPARVLTPPAVDPVPEPTP